MTTTELIEILTRLEHGGITKEPREITIDVVDENGDYYPVLDDRSKLVVSGTGDGCAGASLSLTIEPMPRPSSLPHDDHELENMNSALVSVNKHLKNRVKELEQAIKTLNQGGE